jgi:glycine/D-amino acid oxidase-like deaminating enzyme
MLSYWEKNSFVNSIDVCVIGAGIVGLTTAMYLKQAKPNLKIAVIERSPLPYGASTRNAGFACFGSVSEILENMKTNGQSNVLSLIEQRWKGLEMLKENIGIENLQFEQHGGYEIFTEDEHLLYAQCADAIDSINLLLHPIIGKFKTFSACDKKVDEFGFKKVKQIIYNQCEAQIDTGKMMKSLISKLKDIGVEIFFGLPVLKISDEENAAKIFTQHFNIQCKKVVVCTNGFAQQLIANIDVQPTRAQVLITKPIKNLAIKGTFHYQYGYYYFRNVDDRILLGGGRNLAFEQETTTQMGLTEEIQSRLEYLLSTIILPNTSYEIDMRWSGIMGVGSEQQPIVKSTSKNIFVAVRCNGMGIALGSKIAADSAEMVLNQL